MGDGTALLCIFPLDWTGKADKGGRKIWTSASSGTPSSSYPHHLRPDWDDPALAGGRRARARLVGVLQADSNYTGITPREKGQSLLNNRQAGRRRGRGGQRQQNGGREQGNRIDNRARGNAPQLLEKYKSLARDAQLAGDRVMTEYYLQFADHYFRVVAETRARFEESRPQRDDWQGDEGEDQITAESIDGDEGEEERRPQRRQDNRERNDRNERNARPERSERDRNGDRYANDRGNGRYNGNRGNDDEPVEPATIDVNVLPPSFGSDGMVATIPDFPVDVEEEAPAPRRRGRPRRAATESDVPAEG